MISAVKGESASPMALVSNALTVVVQSISPHWTPQKSQLISSITEMMNSQNSVTSMSAVTDPETSS